MRYTYHINISTLCATSHHVTFTSYLYDSDVVALQLDQSANQEMHSKRVLQH